MHTAKYVYFLRVLLSGIRFAVCVWWHMLSECALANAAYAKESLTEGIGKIDINVDVAGWEVMRGVHDGG